MPIRQRGRLFALATVVLAAGCVGPEAPAAPAPPAAAGASTTGTQVARGQGNAVAEVPEVVAPRPGSSGSAIRPASYAYVSETQRLVFFDQAVRQLAPDVRLSAAPRQVKLVGDVLVLGFPSGNLAVVDIRRREQTARASLAKLRAKALGGDLILDEVRQLPNGNILVAGRIADPETEEYRSFLQERRLSDLALRREEILSPSLGVVQDVAFDDAGATMLLLSSGGVYDLSKRKMREAGAGPSGQVLRYGLDGERWIGSAGERPGVLTPSGNFVPLAGGRVPEIVPLANGTAAALVAEPPQVWVIAPDGAVLSKIDVDDYPYAAALVGERLHVGSVNSDALQIVNLESDRVERRLRLSQGVINVGALP